MNKRVYIIGVGKTGSSFSFELKDKGYEIEFLTDRNTIQLNEIADKLYPVSFSGNIEKSFVAGSEIIIICVQDRNIKDVVKEISEFNLDLSKKFFIISSGSVSSAVFPAELFNKENTMSMHPVQTFDKVSFCNSHLLENIYFGIEGGNSAKELAAEMIGKLNSKFIEIPADKKHLYHSACVISSNFLISLLNVSSEIMGSIGVDKKKTFEIFKPLIEKTLQNISSEGLINSLTGPFERNDVETISNHLYSINKELPSLIPFYTLLGMETVKVAFKKESLNMKNVISILDLMNDYIISESNIAKKEIKQ